MRTRDIADIIRRQADWLLHPKGPESPSLTDRGPHWGTMAGWMNEAADLIDELRVKLKPSPDNIRVDASSGVRYEAEIDRGVARIRCIRISDGAVQFISLNPSGYSDDGVPNVFVYNGPTGDPQTGEDEPEIFIVPDFD